MAWLLQSSARSDTQRHLIPSLDYRAPPRPAPLPRAMPHVPGMLLRPRDTQAQLQPWERWERVLPDEGCASLAAQARSRLTRASRRKSMGDGAVRKGPQVPLPVTCAAMGTCPMAPGSRAARRKGLIINSALGSPTDPHRGAGTVAPRTWHHVRHWQSCAPSRAPTVGSAHPGVAAVRGHAVGQHPLAQHSGRAVPWHPSPRLGSSRGAAFQVPSPSSRGAVTTAGSTYALEGRGDDVVDLRGYLGVGHGAGAVPRDAGLALLLLAGAQGTLSRQHNLWAEMGAQGDASARDAPRGCFTECHHCTEVCSEESTALAQIGRAHV